MELQYDKDLELLDTIRDALERDLRPVTPDEHTFVHEVARIASKAASEHWKELLEANAHLQETVRGMNKPNAVDTGADVS